MLSQSWNSDFLTCFDNADEATAKQRWGGEGKPGSQCNLLVVGPSCLPALYSLNSWNSYEKKATFILIKSLWLELPLKQLKCIPDTGSEELPSDEEQTQTIQIHCDVEVVSSAENRFPIGFCFHRARGLDDETNMQTDSSLLRSGMAHSFYGTSSKRIKWVYTKHRGEDFKRHLLCQGEKARYQCHKSCCCWFCSLLRPQGLEQCRASRRYSNRCLLHK